MTHKKRNLSGWQKDPSDKRDFLFKATLKTKDLPDTCDLRSKMSRPDDQKTIGSCVPHATIGCLEYYENVYNLPYEDLSRLFLYYVTRKVQGDLRDTGCSIRTCLKTLSKHGCCKESLWRYDCRRYKTPPPQKCFADAVRYKDVSYYRINSLSQIKSALAEGNPVIFGAYLYPSFYDADETGIVLMPDSSEECIGGHCLLLCGYSDETQMFLVRNSWGTVFGLKGYCWMPYEYIGNDELADDFWVLKFNK